MDVYEKIKESRNALSPFCQRLGIVVEELREGYARVTKTVGPEDLNPVGVPHGGRVFLHGGYRQRIRHGLPRVSGCDRECRLQLPP